MTHTFKITDVKTISNATEKNRACIISWAIEFEKEGFTSFSVGETSLDVLTSIENFIPIEEVTQEQIVSWVIAKEGGDLFIETLQQINESVIDLNILKSKSTSIDLPYIKKLNENTVIYDLQGIN